jgi:uncharacterized membrane protein YhdT
MKLSPQEKELVMEYREAQTWAFCLTIVISLWIVLAAFMPSKKHGYINDLFRKPQTALRQ